MEQEEQAVISGSVYTNAVSLVTASISMRLYILFTQQRSRLSSKPCRFETGAKSGAFPKRCGFICRVNSKTAKPHRFECGYYFGAKFALFNSKQ